MTGTTQLWFINSLYRRESHQPFVPINAEDVRMYACGPTVYGRIHIGNARMTVVFDLLFRLLRQVYGPSHVTYVSNITDIDDKIIVAAGEANETIGDLTSRMSAFYDADRAALGCLRPSKEPRATDYIPQMIAMIERLIDIGAAYEAQGHVLFSVAECSRHGWEYGRLSGRDREDQIAGARVEIAPYKRDPADFVLWKPSSSDYPGWDSPWGRGRPGWHIECSAMSVDLLGEEFDIHGGGIDLIFPHHENEIAQSGCAHGKVPARHWLHNGHVMVGGQKMSKSLGNFVTVGSLLQRWPGEAIRLALFSGQYRQPLDVTDELLASSKARLDYLYGVLRRRPVSPSTGAVSIQVMNALSENINTPLALARLQELASGVEAGAVDPADLTATGAVMGLLQQDPESWFRWQPPELERLSEAEIEAAIAGRNAARARRDFVEADRLRAHLLENGVALEDSASGTAWKRVNKNL